jgi:hypothetical protein
MITCFDAMRHLQVAHRIVKTKLFYCYTKSLPVSTLPCELSERRALKLATKITPLPVFFQHFRLFISSFSHVHMILTFYVTVRYYIYRTGILRAYLLRIKGILINKTKY